MVKAPDIPSILVETAFISNIEEERKLRTSHFQQQGGGVDSGGDQGLFRQRRRAGEPIRAGPGESRLFFLDCRYKNTRKGAYLCHQELVAEAGFEPATFGL